MKIKIIFVTMLALSTLASAGTLQSFPWICDNNLSGKKSVTAIITGKQPNAQVQVTIGGEEIPPAPEYIVDYVKESSPHKRVTLYFNNNAYIFQSSFLMWIDQDQSASEFFPVVIEPFNVISMSDIRYYVNYKIGIPRDLRYFGSTSLPLGVRLLCQSSSGM